LTGDDQECLLLADPRLAEAIRLFNEAQWYACHDHFEELWYETSGPLRPVLQGILQIAVAQLHHANGNIRGATVLMGEGLGRLRPAGSQALGLDLTALRASARLWLETLQAGETPAAAGLAAPVLHPAAPDEDRLRQ
jgi:predicted metal-dependent hydrolase